MDLNKLRQFLSHDPENDILAIAVVEGLVGIKEYKNALDVIESLLNYYPNDVRFLALKAQIFIALKEYRKALELYNMLRFELNISNESFVINSALSLYQIGQYTQALDCFNQVEQMDRDNSILKTRCLFHLDELDSAISLLESLRKENSEYREDPEILGLLALIYMDNGQYEKVDVLSLKAQSFNREQFDSRLAQASLLVYRQEMNEAILQLSDLDKQVPNSGRIKSMLALCFMYNRDFSKAIELYNKACALMPDHVGTMVNLGWCYLLSEQLDLAESSFNQAIQIDRTFADAYGSLANVHAIKKEWNEVSLLVKRAFKLDKGCAPAVLAYALLLEQRGKQNEADQLINNVMSQQSDVNGVSLKELIHRYMSKA
ncbi:tetratricopeptide repeat protein [Vibrio vulnificus]|nr:tetratricopeptide repeat protein [Vibrio vulnificus]EJP4175448.1 tetratricopeptide repeat protein [Vibrio vulnificus]ELX4197040.1 tetratricopeptide repeat protein [Vibrio vulnificus]